MKKLLSIMILTNVMFYNVCLSQVHISQIKVGDKFPERISLGGYVEVESEEENCSCKVYQITFDKPISGYGSIAETIGIHYSEDNIVVGVNKLVLRTNLEDALKVYIGRFSNFIRVKEIIEHWKLISVRDTGRGGEVDDIFYYKYYNSLENTHNSVGIAKTLLIEEKYLKDSDYTPLLKN